MEDFNIVTDEDETGPPPPDPVARPKQRPGGGELTPKQVDGILVRPNPARSSLEECIETIADLRFAVENAEKIDAGLVRELRVWQERRLELEDRVSRDDAGTFFPPGMDIEEVIGHLQEMMDLALSLRASKEPEIEIIAEDPVTSDTVEEGFEAFS